MFRFIFNINSRLRVMDGLDEEKEGNVDCSGRPSSAEGILDLGFIRTT